MTFRSTPLSISSFKSWGSLQNCRERTESKAHRALRTAVDVESMRILSTKQRSYRLAQKVLQTSPWLVALLLAFSVGAAAQGLDDLHRDGFEVSAPTRAQASRFLQQASFGPTTASIDDVLARGYDGWIEHQMGLPRQSHLSWVTAIFPVPEREPGVNPVLPVSTFYASFWRQALTGSDQLRQRVSFALSQLFVVSTAEPTIARLPHFPAAYYDTLAAHAFGNYRSLLGAVSRAPAMGRYLTFVANQGQSGATPDQNYARELMQLFTIGLVELHEDGQVRLVNGASVATYSQDDVRGLAKVFTGWGFGPPGNFAGHDQDEHAWLQPMVNYSEYHSSEEKRFLGTVIAPGTPGTVSLDRALDTPTHRRSCRGA
jgi:uncharacterized protein (DUF1800 family)